MDDYIRIISNGGEHVRDGTDVSVIRVSFVTRESLLGLMEKSRFVHYSYFYCSARRYCKNASVVTL